MQSRPMERSRVNPIRLNNDERIVVVLMLLILIWLVTMNPAS